MRLISLVPSWTETLLEAGVDVVGRTRFCIHPADKVKSIPVVGGTKDINWDKVSKLEFDFLVLDKEENPKQIADESKWPVIATHITNVNDVPVELKRLAEQLKNQNLLSLSQRWKQALNGFGPKDTSSPMQLQKLSDSDLSKLGLRLWIKKPIADYEKIVYVIWKNPFMAVTKETFIGSILELIGLPTLLSKEQVGTSYPEIALENFDPQKTLFLFSSEPFPFHKKTEELKALNVPAAIVDGEAFSWFGLRSLKFLETQLK